MNDIVYKSFVQVNLYSSPSPLAVLTHKRNHERSLLDQLQIFKRVTNVQSLPSVLTVEQNYEGELN